jgi:hypothetical protein
MLILLCLSGLAVNTASLKSALLRKHQDLIVSCFDSNVLCVLFPNRKTIGCWKTEVRLLAVL